MNNYKLIISDFYNGILLGFQFDDNKLERIFDFSNESVLGNIYCGYVKDIVPNINAAFVEFDKDKKGYLSLKNYTKQIHQGDRVLVQVSGDKIKTKEYTLTGKINLNSSCVVLTVGNTSISISRKISDIKKRDELKSLLEGLNNDEYGFILRTNCINYTSNEIINQAQDLIAKWNEIKNKFNYTVLKEAIIKHNHMTDVCTEFIDKFNGVLLTDKNEIFEKLISCGLPITINSEEKISLCNKYSLEKHLKEALSKKVWLKSGAYIVIEPTEALTVIDVNTGKADIKSEREKTFKKINEEAALEIARQIKVRNLSGIIIIDFINMADVSNYEELQNIFSDAIKYDFAQCNIAGFTKLGLLEVSRKKKEKPLYEIIN